jgi:FkbM family methyltransferase
MLLEIRPHTTDAEVVWQCFSAQQYEVPIVYGAAPLHKQAVQKIYLNIADKHIPLIVDCGANIGASTMWFKMRYPSAAIIALEPASDNCEILGRNCSSYKDITIIEAGIGPNDCDAFLLDNGGGAWGYQTSANETNVKIKMVSIETILKTKSLASFVPFILKIDIEEPKRHYSRIRGNFSVNFR